MGSEASAEASPSGGRVTYVDITLPERAPWSVSLLMSALDDLALAEISLQDPASVKGIEAIRYQILALNNRGDWRANCLRLWSDTHNTEVLELSPCPIVRSCVFDKDDPASHNIVRKCTVSGYDPNTFPFSNGQFTIVPLGKLLVNHQPSSWIVVYGEDKGYWLLRDSVTLYLDDVFEDHYGGDECWRADPESLPPLEVYEIIRSAIEVKALLGCDVARVEDENDLSGRRRSRESPHGLHGLQLYDDTWSTWSVSMGG